jgi:hypothetical protein
MNKNLENNNILSDDTLLVIENLIKVEPTIVFGGSIALNAVGLINRPIKDIDIFKPLNSSLTPIITQLQTTIETTIGSDTVTDVNGNHIQRTSLKINNINCCCFKVSDEELQHSKYRFNRNGKEYSINIQNINYAILAKQSYSKRNPKHKLDIESANNVLDDLFF